MMSLLKTLKDPKTITILFAAHALGLSMAALYITANTTQQQIVIADMQTIMDAQKLVWVKRMKEGATTEVLKESGEFQQKLESVLAQIANDENAVIVDKTALVAGQNVTDVTPRIVEALGISMAEAQLLKRSLEEEIFSDFPAMRKGR